jgi:hypothetical protein
MASKKFYGYYIKGNKLALIEKDVSTSGSDLNAEDYGKYKSPGSTVADGLEIEYTYAPKYKIQTTNDVDTNITQYMSTDGKLTIADNTSAYINYATAYALAADKYIVLEKAGRFNGLHKIESIGNNTGTNNKIVLTTKYTGSESAWTDFEETPNLYYALDVMEDESFDIDLPTYLNKAIVLYLRAKDLEFRNDIKGYQYFMAEFKKQLERFSSSRKVGPSFVQGFWGMR